MPTKQTEEIRRFFSRKKEIVSLQKLTLADLELLEGYRIQPEGLIEKIDKFLVRTHDVLFHFLCCPERSAEVEHIIKRLLVEYQNAMELKNSLTRVHAEIGTTTHRYKKLNRKQKEQENEQQRTGTDPI
jgi:hypothetical protein